MSFPSEKYLIVLPCKFCLSLPLLARIHHHSLYRLTFPRGLVIKIPRYDGAGLMSCETLFEGALVLASFQTHFQKRQQLISMGRTFNMLTQNSTKQWFLVMLVFSSQGINGGHRFQQSHLKCIWKQCHALNIDRFLCMYICISVSFHLTDLKGEENF